MTVIFGTFRDIGGELSQGSVTLQSIITRPSHLSSSEVVTTERHEIVLRNGTFTSPELDPGPTRVHFRGNGGSEEWEITLPEDGRHDLATLIETHVDYNPSVVGRVEAAAADANRAAQVAGQSATRAADAEHRVSLVVASAADVVRGELQVQIDGASQARADAESARVAAESARDVAVAAADRADGAADAVAEDAAAAGDAAGRAEVAAAAADASATAAGVSAGEVGEAREYVSGVHESLLPGGDTMTSLEWHVNATVDAATQARDDRDAAAASATAAAASAAAMQARPAMWLWDGSGQWEAPAEARPIDTVLNTATGEIHAIVEVTA